jgi:hypothetical protein|tara:strand:+ start:1171 stop:1590 length:420 start_codon:yes stop_codon:yes gene_type:complete
MIKNRRANFIPKGRVQVYYNLHKKCLSIRYKGKVIEHAREVTLTDAKFHVSEKGRQRVLKEKRKNVHAYVSGKLKETFWFTQAPKYVWTAKQRVTYNPYKHKSFVDKLTLEPIANAEVVHIQDRLITAGDFDWNRRGMW